MIIFDQLLSRFLFLKSVFFITERRQRADTTVNMDWSQRTRPQFVVFVNANYGGIFCLSFIILLSK